MPTKILITGFEPFGGLTRNPAMEIVRAFSDADVQNEILPVEYSAASIRLDQLIAQHHPSIWIGFGLSQKSTAITLERLAFNVDDASIPDNAGDLRHQLPIDSTGADRHLSTLPLDAIHRELSDRKIPVVFSNTAGRFVCNHVFYTGCAAMRGADPSSFAGFIHLPWPCDWTEYSAPTHKISMDMMTTAISACVHTSMQIRKSQVSAKR